MSCCDFQESEEDVERHEAIYAALDKDDDGCLRCMTSWSCPGRPSGQVKLAACHNCAPIVWILLYVILFVGLCVWEASTRDWQFFGWLHGIRGHQGGEPHNVYLGIAPYGFAILGIACGIQFLLSARMVQSLTTESIRNAYYGMLALPTMWTLLVVTEWTAYLLSDSASYEEHMEHCILYISSGLIMIMCLSYGTFRYLYILTKLSTLVSDYDNSVGAFACRAVGQTGGEGYDRDAIIDA